MKKNILFVTLLLLFSSCAELLNIAKQVNLQGLTSVPVTNAENISGLKSSLDVGIEKFFHAATVQADQVVVVHAFIQLVDGLVGRKAVAP